MNTAAADRPFERIGVVGIGAMGLPIALNLHARGWTVAARDIRPEAEAGALAAGVAVHASARALAAAADLLIVVVVDAGEIEQVLFAADGVLAAGPAAARVVMLCSTIAPADTRRFAERLAAHAIETIDAPVSGGPARARAGTMSLLLAAAAPTLERWAPLLADLSDRRFVVGPDVGDAAKAKLVNNLLAGINLVAGAEALALAEKLGLDPHAMLALIGASSGASWVVADRMPRALAEAWSPAQAAARILTKDLGLALDLAASVDHPTPLGTAARERFVDVLRRGWGDLDDAAVIRSYRE